MDSSLPSPDPQSEELEIKIQELFTANRKIDLLHANVGHLEQENECLKKTIEEGTRLLEEAKKSDGKSKNDELLRQMIEDLKLDLKESLELEKALKEENVRLEKRLQQVLENSVANITTSDSEFDAEEIFSLNAKLSQLGEEKAKLQAELQAMSENLQQQTDEKTRLRQEILEKEEELECMESQFSTQCDISERLRDENQQLKEQLESEEGQVNVAKKGNSLFSEVDDRRVAAETKVVQIHEQMKSLEEMLTREQKENKRLKTQITFLRHNSKKGFDEDAVKGLQVQVVQAKKTIADLTEKLGKLELSQKQNSVTEYRKTVAAEGTDDDKRYITFLEGLIRTKTKEMSELRLQAHSSHQQSIRTDVYLTEANNELQVLRHEVTQLKQRNSHLSMTLQDLKHKYGEDSPDLWSPDRRRQSRKVNSSSTPVATTVPPQTKATSDLKENIPTDSSSKSCGDASSDFAHDRKQNVRLRDLINTTGMDKSSRKEGTGKSVGVQLSEEVKVMSSDGNQSIAELREDGNTGKLRRTKGKGTGKFVSVNYQEMPSDNPGECKQQ